MEQNDTVEVDCSYDDTTGGSVAFGDSVSDEVCFTTLYYAPKLGIDPISCGN